MNGILYNFFVEDHRILDDILNSTDIRGKEYDIDVHSRFHRGLLKHIKIEVTILFPALENNKKDEFSKQIVKLRLDHGAARAGYYHDKMANIENN